MDDPFVKRSRLYGAEILVLAIGCAGCGAIGGDPVPLEVSEDNTGGAEVLFPNLPEEDVPAPATGTVMGMGMPEDFTAADRGGWKLGSALPADAENVAAPDTDDRTDGCGSILTGVLRDMRESHADFGGEVTNLQRGLVQGELGADGKPVLSSDFREGFIESARSFREWYESVPDVNLPYALELYLEPGTGKFMFESHDFFPLDGAGFGNENQDHNFSFTFELHTRFRYGGGEVFQFSGDDDLWVFINGRLAIDLGGVHAAEDQSIALDEVATRLGIAPGNEYALDFFQAERHATQSNFQIETTLEFTNCGVSTTLR